MNFNQQQFPQYYMQSQFNRNYYPNLPLNYSQLNYYQKLQLFQNQYQYQEMLRQSSYYYYLNQQNINIANNSKSFERQGVISNQLSEIGQKKIEEINLKNPSNIVCKKSIEVEDQKAENISVNNNQISNTKIKDRQLKNFEKKNNKKIKIKSNKHNDQITYNQQITKNNASTKLKNKKIIQKYNKKYNNINNNNENQLTQFQIDMEEKKQSLVIKIKRIKKQKKNYQYCYLPKKSNHFSVYPPNQPFPKIHIGENYQAQISEDYYFNSQQYSIKKCEKIICLKQRLVIQNPKLLGAQQLEKPQKQDSENNKQQKQQCNKQVEQQCNK